VTHASHPLDDELREDEVELFAGDETLPFAETLAADENDDVFDATVVDLGVHLQNKPIAPSLLFEQEKKLSVHNLQYLQSNLNGKQASNLNAISEHGDNASVSQFDPRERKSEDDDKSVISANWAEERFVLETDEEQKVG
jgi:hypothetical protein